MEMTAEVKSFGFDATLDEIVDANMRLVEHTSVYRQQRRRYKWLVGLCGAGGVAYGTLRGHEPPSPVVLAISFFAALVIGVGCGLLYHRYHDWNVRNYYRRLLKENMAAPTQFGATSQ
jgi:hypothetical protein